VVSGISEVVRSRILEFDDTDINIIDLTSNTDLTSDVTSGDCKTVTLHYSPFMLVGWLLSSI